MILYVITPFVGHGFNMPAPRSLIEVSEELGKHLISIGVAAPYERKIDPVPDVKKNAEPSASSQADPVRRKRTRKASRKSATK